MKLKILFLLLCVFGVISSVHAQLPQSVASRIGPSGLEYEDFKENAFGGSSPIVIITKQVVNDYQCIPNPGNPPAGNVRVYCDSGTGNLTCLTSSGGACISSSGGSVTSFSAGNLSPLFTTSVATSTSTPALTFTLSNAAQNSVLAGPPSGGAAAPSYQTAPTFSAANLTNLPSGISGLTTGFMPKAASSTTLGNTLCDEGVTTVNRVTCSDTAGIGGITFIALGSSSGFIDFPQGSSSTAVAPCNTSNSICEQAPTAVTSYLVNKPGTAANGIVTNNSASSIDTQGFSGDANHSTTVNFTASQTVGATSLCSTGNCPAGTYIVNLYIDITTACTTTGTLIPWVGYTDDAGAKGSTTTTFFGSGYGAGFVPSTGTLTTTATTDFVSATYVLRSTGAAAINYGYTSSACGSGSLAGNMYLSVVPVQ